MSKKDDTIKVSSESKLQLPLANLIGIILVVSGAVFGYANLTGRIGALETADKVYQKILKKENKYINKISTKKLHKYYSLKDVEKHNTKNDAWLIYNNNIYNVTSFIHKHPGSNAILKGIGKDSTELFDNVGHSNNARYMMKKYYIGKYKKI